MDAVKYNAYNIATGKEIWDADRDTIFRKALDSKDPIGAWIVCDSNLHFEISSEKTIEGGYIVENDKVKAPSFDPSHWFSMQIHFHLNSDVPLERAERWYDKVLKAFENAFDARRAKNYISQPEFKIYHSLLNECANYCVEHGGDPAVAYIRGVNWN